MLRQAGFIADIFEQYSRRCTREKAFQSVNTEHDIPHRQESNPLQGAVSSLWRLAELHLMKTGSLGESSSDVFEIDPSVSTLLTMPVVNEDEPGP